jgi:hypothetical protein
MRIIFNIGCYYDLVFLLFRHHLFCHSYAGGIALENHSNFSFFVIPTLSLLSFRRRRNRTRKSLQLLLFCHSDPVSFVIPTQEQSHSKITPTSPFSLFRHHLFCHSYAGGIALENHSNFSSFVIPTLSLLSFRRRRNRTRKSFIFFSNPSMFFLNDK